ncbi:cytochrome d ubiquinol oxidase subunit II [Bordetella trematum]|uniref:Cytochrome d ubiquinol oxidase subunit II n=1 Tax=Bordetella trematum TaxID=123899 RepID=A0A157S9H7_9BORD|nr:cytochrome d ubiquinol oxidase subunit II [Bordetella trematum]AUL48303.1 cytochrome d ubiquinol oxidase subunit II [Bordetella trematum]AZR95265.1 cytochrome d ubiquinol oxidase subunit II [Bordetella trematum]NNH18191.1 cytochrome d ubiquinol oxidase subunit II [Bordetella trematum]QIM70212.1 cytochrome d ubiquinol oxidase subunit II [Bordetella trematum]SAI49451.1 cytochrome d ubiquinol oxidase subunit II [Bordetella trematum]
MDLSLILTVVWWLLLGVLLMGLAIMVGMDMGVGTLLRFVGRNDDERRVALNIIGPHWDGNQVWFILGGGAIFAAWPLVYATAFSGFYIVMLLLLWSMIVRPLGFEYRSKMPSPRWRNAWDWTLFLSGALPMLIYGAAIGNVLQGVPFHFDWRLTSYYTGSFWELLNPFAVLCGLTSVALSIYMGGTTLMRSAEMGLALRARKAALIGGGVFLVLFVVGGFWAANLDGYELVKQPGAGVPQTPLQQVVERSPGGMLANYSAHPVLWLLPILAVVSVLLGMMALGVRQRILAWWLGALGWICVIGTAGAAMFPFLMPSVTHPSHSLTVWNSGASTLTQGWMLGFTIVFIPLILAYTSWAFWVMRGKVSVKQVQSDDHAY